MKLVVQLALPVVPASNVHVELVNEPLAPVSLKETVPAGVTGVPPFELLSTTVAVHVDGWFTTTGVVQLIVVVVARRLTTMFAGVLWLPVWMLSPPYEPVTVGVPAADPVNDVEQVPAVSRQLVEPSEPEPVELNATVPVGVTVVPVDVSETVTEQVEAALTRTGVVHETTILVERWLTTTLLGVLVLPLWLASPP